MPEDSEVVRLLREIRDLQKEHLEAWRSATERSLEVQRAAVQRQDQFAAAWRRISGAGGVIVAILLALLVYLLVRWARVVF